MLETAEQVIDKGLKGRAAEFIVETGDLFVNGLYEAVDRTLADVEPEFAGSGRTRESEGAGDHRGKAVAGVSRRQGHGLCAGEESQRGLG